MHALRRRPQPRPAGLVGPGSLEVAAGHVRVGEPTWCRSLAVTGYPREVGPGWLEPLLAQAGAAEVALHVEPLAAPVAAERLRRQRARLESARRLDAARGRLSDPDVAVAAADADDLAARLAQGEGGLFRVGLYVTVRAGNAAEVEREAARVAGVAASLLLDARPVTFRALQGWVTTLPIGIDALGLRRTFDTAALAAAFPFASPELGSSSGVLYGANAASRGLVFWDRFAQPNYNAVVLARSGAGKSYLAKLEVLRSLYAGVEVTVVDPEDEYRRLAGAVGGAYLHLGAPEVRLNPFDLDDGPDALVRRALFLHDLVAVLAGEALDPGARAALDRALVGAYAAVGITVDPRSHARPAPVLADLARALESEGAAGAELAARLAPYVTGTHRRLFDGATTTSPSGHLVVFSLRDLPDALKTAATMLVLDATWRRVTDPARRRRRLVVVDEAWLVMREPAGAAFCQRLAKAARKHWCGLSVLTQDAADLLASPLGAAVVTNAATQVLLAQAPQAIDALAEAFSLSAGERAFLLAAPVGEGILLGPSERVGFRALASPAEHALVTSDPAELAALESG